MTWYAHHIYAAPTPAVLDAFGRVWPRGLYHVPNLDEALVRRYEVHERVITADGGRDIEREVIDGPRLPDGGLVVVRELCEPGSHAAEWFGGAATSWRDAPPSGDPIDVTPADVSAMLDPAFAPPLPLLEGLRAISRGTSSTVSLICASSWGGDLEYAFAWVFDGAWERDHVYVLRDRASVGWWSSTHVDRPRVVVEGDVLTLALTHHGLLLTAGFFQLFTRVFPWQRYAVAA